MDAARLRWPSIEDGNPPRCQDLFHFPEMYLVEKRHDLRQQHELRKWRDGKGRVVDLVLVAFMSAVARSENCVLLLDPFFDEDDVNPLAIALAESDATDIRLLTGAVKGDREQLRQTLQEYRNMDRLTTEKTRIFWSALLDTDCFPFLHDRFAIVDGALWHFGSTVGGGHAGLTAASGPWSESDAQGERFFRDCWRRLHARFNAR